MSVPAAYLGIILIWATTPLAIKWSGDGVDFLLGVTARMGIGFVVCLLLLALLRIPLRWQREATATYLAAGLGLYGAMVSVYWGAQFIPSGLISVLYGLSPILIGLFATLWLGEALFSPSRWLGVGVSLAGLMVIFLPQATLGAGAVWGILGVLLSVALHSVSAVWVKRIGSNLHPLAINGGALAIAVPLYFVTWLLFGKPLPEAVPARALSAILYLAFFGTVLGFALYFYVLKRVSPAAIGLVTLITPVLALLLGQGLNGERIDSNVWFGTAAILGGLSLFQWGSRLRLLLRGV